MSTVSRGELPGLPAERTALAWERTALGLVATGALLLAREGSSTDPGPLVAAGAALLLAVMATVLGWRRARDIRRLRSGRAAPARTEIRLLGYGVIVLGSLIAVAAAL